MDILIKNAKIIDGCGNPWFRAEIGISDGKISKIASKINADAKKIIDAKEMIVCPGFIDVHSHTDFIFPFYSRADSFVQQGITTCVVGMCGQGLAPIHPNRVDEFRKSMGEIVPVFKEIDIKWNTFSEYIKEMVKRRTPINLIFFVGFEAIRVSAGPAFDNRPPTEEEIKKMRASLAEAMESGAFGMSTGLIYAPQIFASTEEITEVAKELKTYGGLYFTHIRDEGGDVLEAIKEAIAIVENSGCKGGQIAHHKIAGRKYWGLSKETLKLISEANQRGISIYCDSYPYIRSMTTLKTGLPPWAREGNDEKILERLRDPKQRTKIIESVKTEHERWENLIHDDGFEHIFISSVNSQKWKPYIGDSIAEATKKSGRENVWDTFFDLLIDDNLGIHVTIEDMGEGDIKRILSSRYQMVGTDGAAIPANPGLGAYHPRFFGTYPRILRKYVREEKVITIENAIRKMTSFPAQRLGLTDRGVIKEGMCADIVIFDSEKITDKATFINPHQFPEGISHVIVNGVVVVKNQKQFRKTPGKILRPHT
ncbi:MAG: amidohydrolase family protein [Candidatus Lokiarchaeota archaeon]|nr:amidohydrolase family protein [Candidatus Lokiarchaeota archaeon]MBD3341273.1 amidohydrolase family protein [Candidatus Lokiarchaeota archaeon]